MLHQMLLSLLLFVGLQNTYPMVYKCNTNNIFQTVALIKEPGAIVRIDSWVDLRGRTLTIPANSTLVIDGGGVDNGCIIGTNTTLSAGLYQIFGERFQIKGKWNVDHAYAEWYGQCGINDDTPKIQKCLDSFFQCKLLNRTYKVTTIKMPDNALLEGTSQGRYQCSTLQQNKSYSGSLITTGNEEYSGVTIRGLRITGGNNYNTAICITVPESQIQDVIFDQFFGNGIQLKDRAWSTTISHCSLFGNMSSAKNRQPLTGIVVDTKGGLISIDHCNINYFETGIHLKSGVQVSINNCNISECSQNELKHPDACIKVSGGVGIDIYDNYIENFNTGVLLLAGKQVSVHNNYLNGLSVASFGVDIKGVVKDIVISNNYIYMGYKGAWAIALRTTKIDKGEITVLNNDLENKKLYNVVAPNN